MSMRDLGVLATRLIEEFPQYYPYFNQTEFAFDGRAPDNRFNRNPVLQLGIGADGLKTGHTKEAGFGLVGSALQGERRIVFVISGLESAADRAKDSEAIINWAMRQFTMKTVAEAGVELARAEVWLGEAADVGLVAGEDITLLVPALQRDGVEAQISWTGPLQAPIAAGQEVGRMVIHRAGLPDTEVPLLAAQAVAEAGFMARLNVAFDKVLALVLGGGDAPALTN